MAKAKPEATPPVAPTKEKRGRKKSTFTVLGGDQIYKVSSANYPAVITELFRVTGAMRGGDMTATIDWAKCGTPIGDECIDGDDLEAVSAKMQSLQAGS